MTEEREASMTAGGGGKDDRGGGARRTEEGTIIFRSVQADPFLHHLSSLNQAVFLGWK